MSDSRSRPGPFFGPGMRNFLGAFADGAILFPLLIALSASTGSSSSVFLASAGGAYLLAAFLFRVPMPVQPLKSLAIAAIAIGATSAEIRVSAVIFGVCCLSLLVLDVDRLASKVPESLIHGLQLALGLLLLTQGVQYGCTLLDQPWVLMALVVLVAMTLLLNQFTDFPFLGLIATLGLTYTIFGGGDGSSEKLFVENKSGMMRPDIIMGLVLPQLALTLANSVLATQKVTEHYFGERAWRVTPRRLLHSIGWGNFFSAGLGGLPFCHGSGGVTAHFKGGANHWISNVIIGGSLFLYAGILYFSHKDVLQYPPFLLASLLAVTGVFHLFLARPTWVKREGKWKLLLMGATAILTRNMLVVLGVGMVAEFFLKEKWFESVPDTAE